VHTAMSELTEIDGAIARRIVVDLVALANTTARLRATARVQEKSLAELARMTGIRYERIERVMNGRLPARRDETRAIAKALRVEMPE
jgi:hypothetical protein